MIRQALAHEEMSTQAVHGNTSSWSKILQFIEKRKMAPRGEDKPKQWNRQELYEERENRWDRRNTEK